MVTRIIDDAELVNKIHAMRESGATYVQIKSELQVSASTISRALGVYGKGRKRPSISEQTRIRARELRVEGLSVPEIAEELGIAKSTAWLITKEIAWEPTPDRVERGKRAAQMRWDRYKARRTEERNRIIDEMAAEVGELSERELLLIGAVMYWAEGAKMKPWNSSERLTFINSDPDVIVLYLEWLRLMGVSPDRLAFSVHIHESADVPAAEKYWAGVAGIPVGSLARTTLKKHNPKTVRKNTGDQYRGCLVVRVRGGAAEYRRMDGLWRGICKALQSDTVASE
jgi:DNA-binding CsgD family transcriptional regulator